MKNNDKNWFSGLFHKLFGWLFRGKKQAPVEVSTEVETKPVRQPVEEEPAEPEPSPEAEAEPVEEPEPVPAEEVAEPEPAPEAESAPVEEPDPAPAEAVAEPEPAPEEESEPVEETEPVSAEEVAEPEPSPEEEAAPVEEVEPVSAEEVAESEPAPEEEAAPVEETAPVPAEEEAEPEPAPEEESEPVEDPEPAPTEEVAEPEPAPEAEAAPVEETEPVPAEEEAEPEPASEAESEPVEEPESAPAEEVAESEPASEAESEPVEEPESAPAEEVAEPEPAPEAESEPVEEPESAPAEEVAEPEPAPEAEADPVEETEPVSAEEPAESEPASEAESEPVEEPESAPAEEVAESEPAPEEESEPVEETEPVSAEEPAESEPASEAESEPVEEPESAPAEEVAEPEPAPEEEAAPVEAPESAPAEEPPRPVWQVRWEQLQSAPCHEWAIRRLVGLGVPAEELKRYVMLQVISEIPEAECPAGLETLEEPAWLQALAMCREWEEILQRHRDAFRIGQMQLAAIPAHRISQQLQLPEVTLEGRVNALRTTLVQWFVKHAPSLGFLWDGVKLHAAASRDFFGRTIAEVVQMLLPPPHVLTPWEKLERRLYEQLRDVAMLGDIELTDVEFELLMEEFRTRYRSFTHQENPEHVRDAIMCVALVQIAIRDYRNHAYWPQVASRLRFSRVSSTLRKLGDMFTATMMELHKPHLGEGGNVASILMHAFACNDCIPKLFDFLYDYYTLDISRDVTQADAGMLCGLIGSDEEFPRAYLLYQHTRHSVRYFLDSAVRRIQEYIKWIDGAFWDASYEPDGEERFIQAFREWRSKHPDFSGAYGISANYRTGKRRFSHPELQLDMCTGRISLHFPRQQLPLHIAEDVAWQVDGAAIPMQPCELTEGATCLHTQEITAPFPLDALLSEVTCTLKAGDRSLRTFVIPADCVRVFDEQGMQLSNRRLHAGMNICFAAPEAPLQFRREAEEQQVGPWLMQRCSLETGDVVLYPDGTASIVGYDLSEGLCGVAPAERAFVTDLQGERYEIFPHMPLLFIRTTPERYEGGRLLVNGRYIRLKELECKQIGLYDRSDEAGFLITLPAQHEGPCELYHIHCDIPGERDVRVWRFVYLRGFDYRFESDGGQLPYWGVPRGSVTVFYPEPLTGENLVKHPRKNEFGFDILPELQEICLQPLSGAFRIHLEAPVVVWRMDEQEWRTGPLEEIWLSDLGRTLQFRTAEKEVTLMVDRDAQTRGRMVTFARPQQSEYVTCDLTQLRTWLTRDRIMHALYACIGQRKVLLAKVFCASHLADARLEADYRAGGVNGFFDIIGRGRYVVSVAFEGEMVAEQVPIEDSHVFLPLRMDAGMCEATIYEVETDEFGFGEQLYELGTAKCYLIDPANLCGRRFILNSLVTLNRQPVRYDLAYKRYWIKLETRDEEQKNRYYGVMRITSSLDENSEMAVIVTVPDRTDIRHCQLTFMEDGEEESFLYDFAKQRIVCREAENLHYMERYRRYSLIDPEDLLQVTYT